MDSEVHSDGVSDEYEEPLLVDNGDKAFFYYKRTKNVTELYLCSV